jgi:hypothetical protein
MDSIKFAGRMSDDVRSSASRIALRTPGSEMIDAFGAEKYGVYPLDRFSISATAPEYKEFPYR